MSIDLSQRETAAPLAPEDIEETPHSLAPRTVFQQENCVLYKFDSGSNSWVDGGRGIFSIKTIARCGNCGGEVQFWSSKQLDAQYRCKKCQWKSTGLPGHDLWVELTQMVGAKPVFVGRALPKITTFHGWAMGGAVRIDYLGVLEESFVLTSIAVKYVGVWGRGGEEEEEEGEKKEGEEGGEEVVMEKKEVVVDERKREEERKKKEEERKKKVFHQERISWEMIDVLKKYPVCVSLAKKGQYVVLFRKEQIQLLRLRDGQWIDGGIGCLSILQTSNKYAMKLTQSTGKLVFMTPLGNARYSIMGGERKTIMLSCMDFTLENKKGEPVIVALRISPYMVGEGGGEEGEEEVLKLSEALGTMLKLEDEDEAFFESLLRTLKRIQRRSGLSFLASS